MAARGARPVWRDVECNAGFNGRRSACGATYGAADTQEVDVAAHDEHRVRNTHLCRITRLCPVCPALVSHVRANPRCLGSIPDPARFFSRVTPAIAFYRVRPGYIPG
jgi:hypothetical protein